MKQVLVGKTVSVSDVPSPGLGSGQVLVEVAYSLISTGTEMVGAKAASMGMLSRAAKRPEHVMKVLKMVRVDGVKKTMIRVKSRLDSPNSSGYSCSGRVIAVGKDVDTIAVGDLVACAGGGYACHAEVVAVPVNLVAKLPDGCDLRAASGATIAAIALQGVRQAELALGETAAVIGLGLLGQITLQLLSASGVRALGFDPNPRRVEEARRLGFDECFAQVGADAVGEASRRTADRGVDATIITAATNVPGICQDAMEMTRRRGRAVVVGAVPLAFERSPFYQKEIDFRISCSYGPGRYDPSYEEGGHDYPYDFVRWTENRNLQAVLALIAQSKLDFDPLIAAEYGIAEADAAFAALSPEEGPRPLAIAIKYDVAAEPSPDKLRRSVSTAPARPIQDRIGLGVIGVGAFFSDIHMPNLMVLADRYAPVSVCDMNAVRARNTARQMGAPQACTEVEELLANKDVQLVLIATRHDTHAPLARRALEAGKHVFVEKPMAMDPAELEQLAEDIRAAEGSSFMLGFNRRFSPHVRQLRKLLAGRTTPLVTTYRILAGRAPRDSWIHSPAGGGRVIGEACHMLDLLCYLAGDDVAVTELDVITPPGGHGEMPSDNIVASLRFEDGSLCTLTYTTLGRPMKGNGKERIEACWDGKTFVIEDFVRCTGAGCSAGSAAKAKGKGHFEELVAFADHLEGKAPPPISLESLVKATDLSLRVDAVCRGQQEKGE